MSDAGAAAAGAGAGAAAPPPPDQQPDQHPQPHHNHRPRSKGRKPPGRRLLDFSDALFVAGAVLYVAAGATNLDQYYHHGDGAAEAGGPGDDGPVAATGSSKFTYLAASALFLLSGVVDSYVHGKQRRYVQLLASSAICFAASFGVASALLATDDESGSNSRPSKVLNNVSAHFWVLDAVGDLFVALRPPPPPPSPPPLDGDDGGGDGGDEGEDSSSSSSDGSSSSSCLLDQVFGECGPRQLLGGLSKYARCIVLSGALAFVVGTAMELVVSYLYLFQDEYEQLAVAALVTPVFWLFAAVCYVLGDCVA